MEMEEHAYEPECHEQLEENLNDHLGRIKTYLETNRLHLNTFVFLNICLCK